MKRVPISDEEVEHKTRQPAAKKARVEQQRNEQSRNAAQDLYHEIQEVLGEEKRKEFETILLSFKQSESTDVAAVTVQKAREILEGNPKLLLSFNVFFNEPNKLKPGTSSPSKPPLFPKTRINSEKVEKGASKLHQEPIDIPAAAANIGAVGTLVIDGSSSRPPEEISRGYCCVLGLSFPRRLRSGITRKSRIVKGHNSPS